MSVMVELARRQRRHEADIDGSRAARPIDVASRLRPHTMLSCLQRCAPDDVVFAGDVPHTMLCALFRGRSSCPTRCSGNRRRRTRCPRRCCLPSLVPQTMLSSSLQCPTRPCLRRRRCSRPRRRSLSRADGAPDDRVSRRRCVAEPQMTSARHAFASGRSTPPPMRWLPQLMCLFHGVGSRSARCPEPAPVGEALRELHGAARIQESGALRQGVVARLVFGGVLQDRFHQIRRERRVRLHHQRDRAG